MRAKLVKYPFDKKKYRWNIYEQGREFEYTWERYKTTPFDHVRPYMIGNRGSDGVRKGAYDFTANNHPTVGYTANGDYQFASNFEIYPHTVEFTDKYVQYRGYTYNYYPDGYTEDSIHVSRNQELYLTEGEQVQYSAHFYVNALAYGFERRSSDPIDIEVKTYLHNYFSYIYNGETIRPTAVEFHYDGRGNTYHPYILAEVYIPYFVNTIVPSTAEEGVLIDTGNAVWTAEEVCNNLFNNSYEYGFYGCEGTVKGYEISNISTEDMLAHGYWARPIHDTYIEIEPGLYITMYEGTDYPKEGNCIRNMYCTMAPNGGWSYAPAYQAMAAGFSNFTVREHYIDTEPTTAATLFRTIYSSSPTYYGAPTPLLPHLSLVRTLTKKLDDTRLIYTGTGRNEA